MGLAELFGKKKSPEELAREFKRQMREQERALDRQLRQIEREEAKLRLEIKRSAKKNETQAVRTLAKELVRSKKAKARMFSAKAQLNSVTLHMQQQVAQAKVMGAVAKSTEIMKIMNNLVKVPEISAAMREMSQQMEKAGLMEEMMNDTLDEALGGEDLEDETDEAVDNILGEVLGNDLKSAIVGKSKIPEVTKTANEDLEDEMMERIASLKQ